MTEVYLGNLGTSYYDVSSMAELETSYDDATAGDIIRLREGTYTLTQNFTFTKDIKIIGAGIGATFDGDETYHFTINSGKTVLIKDLTFYQCKNTSNGGAINNTGTLTIENCTFNDNEATAAGGAINNTGTITITNTKFDTNSAGTYGGAISTNNTALTLFSSQFMDNTATINANDVYNSNNTIIIINSCYIKTPIDSLHNAITDTNNSAHPIGSIFTSGLSTPPETLFGGLWRSIEGRVLIGAGTVIDENGVIKTFTAGTTGGSLHIALENTPIHNHSNLYDGSVAAGNRVSWVAGRQGNLSGKGVGWGGNDIVTGYAGEEFPTEYITPYQVCYMWKRVA